MNKEFFKNNREKLMEQIEDDSVVLLFAGKAPNRSADQAYTFTPNRNFYYLTGIDEENILLLMTKRQGKVEEILFVQSSDPKMEKWLGKKLSMDEAKALTGIKTIMFVSDFESHFNQLNLRHDLEHIYLDLEKRDWEMDDTQAVRFARKVQEKYAHLKIRNLYHRVASLRMIKSEEEVRRIKEAIRITGEGIKALMRHAKPGMMEYQLEAHFDYTIKSLGAKEPAFHTIAASGKNATVLHYEQNNCVMEDGELVLFDLGAEYGYYASDISRTFPVNGQFTDRQKVFYNLVLEAQLETIKAAKPGVTTKELNDVTKKVLAEGCKALGLIETDKEISKYYYHGVSHFMGLDTHDVGDYERKLEPGMIITVEPGLYIEEEEIGIRIEDDLLITEEGCTNLSKHIIKTVEEIEAFMQQ